MVATLVRESVVHRAVATASSPSSVAARVGISAARPFRTFSSGNRDPMIPVDRCWVQSGSVTVAAASIAPISS